MIHRSVVAGALAAFVAGQATAASPPLELEPSSRWNVDYGRERCTLMRDFGSGETAVRLQIDSFGYWNMFRVMLAGPAIPRVDRPAGTAQVRRNGDPEPSDLDTLQGKSGTAYAVSFSLGFSSKIFSGSYERMSDEEKKALDSSMNRPEPDYDATVTSLSIRVRGTTMVLHTGSMARPLVAMRACIDDLYKSWGMDPAQQKTLFRDASPARSTVNHVKAVYPTRALFNGTNAYVPVRLAIDTSGNATSCVVQAEGVDKLFSDAVCDNLQGKFRPALDSNGNPVASMYHTSVVYLVNRPH
jgi:hypothetical protein